MKKLIFALALTTAFFAASTAWLAYELRIERARSASRPMLSQTAPGISDLAPTRAAASPVAVERAAPVAATAAATPRASEPRPRSPASEKEEERVIARDELAELTDPTRRAAYLARARVSLRRTYAGLAKKTGMTPEEESRFFDLLAEQQARWIEMASRCDLQPSGCDRAVYFREQEQAKQEQVAQLGQDRFDRFIAFRDAGADRAVVRELRTHLADAERLSEAQEDRLTEVLSEERRKFTDEAEQRGEKVHSFGMESGSVSMAVTPGGSSADRLKSADEFNRRRLERAKAVLSSAQLDAFQQLQEEVMTWMRDTERREELVRSARSNDARAR